MNFRDRWVTDEEGEEFLFTVEMQRKLSENGLPVEPSALGELEDEESPPKKRAKPQKSANDSFEAPQTIQIDPQTGKYVGRMKWYNTKKGYGFIIRGGGEEIFFHKTGVVGNPNNLDEGQWVLYDVEETKKGPEATDVEPYESDTSDLLG